MISTNMKIMVVDDEKFVRKLTAQALGNLDYNSVETSADGAAALDLLASPGKTFDLIICDLNMPGMDGIEFIRHAHERDFNGSLIIYSGHDNRMLDAAMRLAAAYDLNVLGVLKKPIRVNDLKALLLKDCPEKKRSYAPMKSISKSELIWGIMAGDGGAIDLVYQPKIKISTGEIVGVEALARWQHKDRGILPPPCFIPLAEECGLIGEFSKVVFKKAVKSLADWNARGLKMDMSVNFSLDSFSDSDLSDYIMEKVVELDVDPEQLTLEVTETQIFDNSVISLEQMVRLRLRKFGLSIDDFGTGAASMEQLKKIPFSELKIDRAFVQGAVENPSARAILEASVDLAKKLDMHIVAEGAETREDWEIVESLGCDQVQGYYCAKPMSSDELIKFCTRWDGPHGAEENTQISALN